MDGRALDARNPYAISSTASLALASSSETSSIPLGDEVYMNRVIPNGMSRRIVACAIRPKPRKPATTGCVGALLILLICWPHRPKGAQLVCGHYSGVSAHHAREMGADTNLIVFDEIDCLADITAHHEG